MTDPFDFNMVYVATFLVPLDADPPSKSIAIGVWKRYPGPYKDTWFWHEPAWDVRTRIVTGEAEALPNGVVHVKTPDGETRVFLPLTRAILDTSFVPAADELREKYKTDRELQLFYLLEYMPEEWEDAYEASHSG